MTKSLREWLSSDVAAVRGKPVVACGEAFYGGMGFTCEAPAPRYFACAMDAARDVAPHMIAAARRFTYVFFEKYCRAKNADEVTSLVEENM